MKHSRIKWTIGILLLLFVLIQFMPAKTNYSDKISANAIQSKYYVPENVQSLLRTSCYDCHSNNTSYPWYNHIQPVKWWLSNHIEKGKKHLNFDEFATYPKNKKLHRLDDIVSTIRSEEMPLASYTIIHTNAKLTDIQKETIEKWVEELKRDIMGKEE